MALKFYYYDKCSTCRNAIKFLDGRGIEYHKIPIRDKPPTRKEIKEMVAAYDGDIGKLFNVSGGDYRGMGLKNKMNLLNEGQKVDLLVQNGNLVKRPFLIGDGVRLVGFKEEPWTAALG